MSEDIDPFKILNLPEEDVSQAAIEKAFKGLALKYHPDKNPDPGAQETFQRIQLAKEMLLDADTKAALLRVKRAKRAREERDEELEGQALEQANARKRFAQELEKREKEGSSARTELQRAQASLTAQMRKWHEERLARKREQLRKQAPTAAAAAEAAATVAGTAPKGTASEPAESGTKGQAKPVDPETIGLLHKSLEVRWSSQHVQHDADSLRKVFEKFGDVVHVSMRGKRRIASTQRKAVVVMARSSAAKTAAAQGTGAGTHILVTPLPKVANLESLPGASPEVVASAAAHLQRAGVKGGGHPLKATSSVGLAAAAVAASQSVGAPSQSASKLPLSSGPDALTAVLAAAAAAAGGVATSGAGAAAVTTGTSAAVPTSFPPSFSSFPVAGSARAGPSGTTAAAAASGADDLMGSNAMGSGPLPTTAAVPSSFPAAPPMHSGTTQATDTPFRAPENRVAPGAEAAASQAATQSASAGLPVFPLNVAAQEASLQEGDNSISAATAAASAGAEATTATPGGATATPNIATAVQKQLEREKLRAQRLAELNAKGSSDEGE